MQFQTLVMFAVPREAPQNLRVTKVSTHSVSLTWEAPPFASRNGAIIGYTIQVLDERNIVSHLSSRQPSVTVQDLEDNRLYNFSVAANTSIGIGPYSLHLTVKTKNYGESHIVDPDIFMC